MNSTSNNIIIGETCLLSYQLRRLNIVTKETGIFENMLVNLDGVRSLIEDDFIFALHGDYLSNDHYVYYPEHNIGYNKWVNKKYTLDIDDIFSWPVFSYFHYDILDQERLHSIDRKIDRLKAALQTEKNTNLFYYYRPSSRFNLQKFLEKADSFISFLEKKYDKTFRMFLLTKKDNEEVKVTTCLYDKIIHSEFVSPHVWTGIDDNWNGSSDNNLFDIFQKQIEEYL